MSPIVHAIGAVLYVNGIPLASTPLGTRRRGLYELRRAAARMHEARAAKAAGRLADVRVHVHAARLLHRSGRRNLEVAALAAAYVAAL